MHITKGLRVLCLGFQDLRPQYSYAVQNIFFRKVTLSAKINSNETRRNISQANNEISVTTNENDSTVRKAKISKAMKDYLQRSVEHGKFMNKKVTEYEIGKRHLANMMGEDPQTFTQDDINEAIKYLMPSGLFEPKARPMMNHPLEDYQRRKEAEFDESGRPFHTLFYTRTPKLYSILQQISIKAEELDKLLAETNVISENSKLNIHGSRLLEKIKLEDKLLEKFSDKMYEHLSLSFERLIDHPLSSKVEDFILKYREPVLASIHVQNAPELMYTEKGVPYMKASGLRRKSSAEVTVYGGGSGKFTVNGKDILYFDTLQDREQVMFPLQYSGMLKSVDVEATAEGGGPSGQSGAIRYAISQALKSFVSPSMIEKMRIAGLLTADKRKKERKKPGYRRARAKFIWKRR